MTASLADVRDDLFTILDATDAAQTYRGRRTNYQYPAFVIIPTRISPRAAMGGYIAYVVDVMVGVEVTDEDGSEDELDELVGTAIDAINGTAAYDVQETEGLDALASDGRLIGWWRLEVAVLP